MAKLTSRNSWEKRVSLDGDAPKMDKGNVLHNAVLAQTIRDIRNGDFDNMGNLQKVANLFTLDNSGNKDPVLMGSVTVTTLKDTTGILHEVEDDPQTVSIFLDNGMTVHSTVKKDIYSK